MSIEGYESARRPTPGWQRFLLIGGLVVAVLVGLKYVGGISGLVSSGDCPTHLEYPVPEQRLKGVKDVKLTAERCKRDSDTGRTKPYVLVTVDVNGETADHSRVRSLRTTVRLDRRPSAGGNWERKVSPTDIPADTGVSINGSQVAYSKQWRWDIPRSKARIRVSLVLRTNKGKPARVIHVFNLP